jgi:hypothetical protein
MKDKLIILLISSVCLLGPIAAGMFLPWWGALLVAAAFILMGMRTQGSPALLPWLSGLATLGIMVLTLVVSNWAGILHWLVEHTT